jgi:hypothetical protein
LRGLLAKEVVDAEDLRLQERLVDEVVERHRTVEVGAERLLHYHARPLHQIGLAQHRDDSTGGLRGDRKIVQPTRFGSQLGFGLGHRGCQRIGSSPLWDVAEHLGEAGPLLVGKFVRAELVDRVPRHFAELVHGQVLQRGPDDLNVRSEVGLVEVGEARDQLSLGQVARRSEKHDDVWVHRDVVMTVRTRLGGRVRDGLGLLLRRHPRILPPTRWPCMALGPPVTTRSRARLLAVTRTRVGVRRRDLDADAVEQAP